MQHIATIHESYAIHLAYLEAEKTGYPMGVFVRDGWYTFAEEPLRDGWHLEHIALPVDDAIHAAATQPQS